jgi:SAM-dependent methyltransferase
MDERTRSFYRENATQLGEIYDRDEQTHVHHLATLLRSGDSVLDVGCGTGRDVAALLAKGFDATGVDPSPEMIAEAERRYPQTNGRLHQGALPDLVPLPKAEFDAVLCVNVLHHLRDSFLLDALYRLRSVVASNGFLVIRFPVSHPAVAGDRHEDGRVYHVRAAGEYAFFLRRLGMSKLTSFENHNDATGSDWVTMVFANSTCEQLSPIETVESILWDDRKVNTYKFALVRALAEIASRSTRRGTWRSDGRVAVPVDAIAERWIEYYWPLLEHSGGSNSILLGQRSDTRQDMVFRRQLQAFVDRWDNSGGYRAFRRSVGMEELSEPERNHYQALLRNIAKGIGQPVKYAGSTRTGKNLFAITNQDVVLSGEMWTELATMGRWIEDSVLLRWAEFVARLKNQDPTITAEIVLSRLLSPRSESDRDTSAARDLFTQQIDQDGGLECVWSELPIGTPAKLAVDHAIPFALWFCNDLWNLLPTEREINNQKRDKLPTRSLIEARERRIVEAWEVLWEKEPNLFQAHAARLTGTAVTDFDRSARSELFREFKNAVEFTGTHRGIERWEPG